LILDVCVVLSDQEDGRIVMTNPSDGKLELLVKDLVPSDMSNYTCRSVNKAGFHDKNGTITVNCAYIYCLLEFFIFAYLIHWISLPVISSTNECYFLLPDTMDVIKITLRA